MNGFLGTRASIMLDVVFLAMFAVLPVLGWSIWLVRSRRRYALHKRVQVMLAVVLLVAIGLFELDLRFGAIPWEDRAADSPYFDTWVYPSLYVHLSFAVPTAVVWVGVITAALRRFAAPPLPNSHSRTHRRWGWIAAWGMLLTGVTGWVFYTLAFVA